MLLREQEIGIPAIRGHNGLLSHLEQSIKQFLPDGQVPIRFVVTKTDKKKYHCELGILADAANIANKMQSIFKFMPRKYENTEKFNAVLIVPTGIGAEIGGHAGDAAPVVRMMASVCDTVITHPNVVNASDINELPDNGLYVEGSIITRLLMGTIALQKVRSNRIMLVIDKHQEKCISDLAINAASAARAAMGIECPLAVEMDSPIRMRARYSTSGSAVGRIEFFERLHDILTRHRNEYDAVALASVIDVPTGFHMEYFQSRGEMVNPWGGVEAMLTHTVSTLFNVPSAHAPMMESSELENQYPEIVDPRMAAEAVSNCFLHCVLKGLHKSPRIIQCDNISIYPNTVNATDISCLVIPDGCIGLPTLAALEQGIPVIAVRENRNHMKNNLTQLSFAPGKLFIVDNYWEAMGIMTALKAGVAPSSVRRPLAETKVVCEDISEKTSQAKVSDILPVAKE